MWSGVVSWLWSWVGWLTGSGGRKQVVEIINFVTRLVKVSAPYITQAEAVIAHVDRELKPAIKDEEQSTLEAIVKFLRQYTPNYDFVDEFAEEVADLDMADLLLRISSTALMFLIKDPIQRSTARWIIETAYQAYQARQRAVEGKAVVPVPPSAVVGREPVV